MAYSKEIREEVLERIKNGESTTTISKETGIGIRTIHNWIHSIKGNEQIHKKSKSIRTPEEYKQNESIKRMLEYIKQGKTDKEIARMPDIEFSKSSVYNYKSKCLEIGLITQEEIEKAKEERKKQKKSQNLKENEQPKKILEYLKKGLLLSEISKMPDINLSRTQISRYKKIFIQEGLITEEQINKAKKQQKPKQPKPKQEKPKQEKPKQQKPKQKKPKQPKPKQQKPKTTKKENKTLDPEKTEELLSYLKQGYNPEIIKIYMKLDNKTYQETLKQLIKENKITTKTMSEKQKQKETEYKIRIYLKNIRDHISSGEYSESIKVIQQATTTNIVEITKEEKEKLQKILNILIKAEKVKKAETAIKEGNQNTETLTELTGLTREEINFLKLRLSPEKSKISGISRREKILNLLASGNQSAALQKTLQICDFEMDDILDQYKYRIKEPEKRNDEEQIKQDSTIRLSAILTKLGKNPKSIAQILKIQPEQVSNNIKLALKTHIIEPDQLKGIKLLKLNEIALDEIER